MRKSKIFVKKFADILILFYCPFDKYSLFFLIEFQQAAFKIFTPWIQFVFIK